MDLDEKRNILKQVDDLRVLYTSYSNRDDVKRMRDAADTIENLLFLVEQLELNQEGKS